MKLQDVAVRAAAYDIPYKIVDGNDAVAVFEAAKEAVEYCRAGKGPYFIETKTFKYRGHFEGDAADYRSQEEVDYWMSDEMDPIPRMRRAMLAEGITHRRSKI